VWQSPGLECCIPEVTHQDFRAGRVILERQMFNIRPFAHLPVVEEDERRGNVLKRKDRGECGGMRIAGPAFRGLDDEEDENVAGVRRYKRLAGFPRQGGA
jgi:hypothetical protein